MIFNSPPQHKIQNFFKSLPEPGNERFSLKEKTRLNHLNSRQAEEKWDIAAYIPLVHVAVDHGVVHGVGHGEPVHQQVDLLYIRSMIIIICYKHEGIMPSQGNSRLIDFLKLKQFVTVLCQRLVMGGDTETGQTV